MYMSGASLCPLILKQAIALFVPLWPKPICPKFLFSMSVSLIWTSQRHSLHIPAWISRTFYGKSIPEALWYLTSPRPEGDSRSWQVGSINRHMCVAPAIAWKSANISPNAGICPTHLYPNQDPSASFLHQEFYHAPHPGLYRTDTLKPSLNNHKDS